MRKLRIVPFVSFEHLFHTYLKTKEPVLLRNTWQNDRAFTWTPDTLKKRIGNAIVKVTYAHHCRYSLNQQEGGFTEEPVYLKFRDFVDDRLESGRYYLQQTSIADSFPELVADADFRELIDPDLIHTMNIWIGGAGTISPLHYDFANNFLIQCHGTKRVILFESEQTEYLYAYEVQDNRYPHMSQLDINNPDIEAFPQYRHAEAMEVVLKPSDILFLPSTTWHQVESTSVSISVNVWFMPFDFQYTWPNIVRLLPGKYADIPYLHKITVPYQFANVLEFCDRLLELDYHYEACISYVALLEHLVRKRAIAEKNVSSVPTRNDIRQAITAHPTLLNKDFYNDSDRMRILAFLNAGKEMLELNGLNCTREKAMVMCNDIRSMIAKLNK